MSEPVRVTVHVTAEDIARGVRRCPLFCPVARALDRSTGLSWTVSGLSGMAAGRRTRFPGTVTAFVEAFDSGALCAPFDFEFEYTPEVPAT